jgi:hypothetical protein
VTVTASETTDATPRTLFLHVGQTKTGSSYLQSSFASFAGTLASHGVAYLHEAEQGEPFTRVTVGNAASLTPDTLGRWIDPRLPHALLSSELSFAKIAADPTWLPAIAQAARASGFEEVRLLLFLRDPHEWLASQYLQHLKRRGETRSFGRYARAFGGLDDVQSVVRASTSTPGVDATILSYRRHKEVLATRVWEWLGVPTMPTPPAVIVNRSPDAAEARVLWCVNRVHPRIGAELSTRWIERIPDHPAQRPHLSDDEWAAFRDRVAARVHEIDGMLPPDERYVFPHANPFTEVPKGRMTASHVAVVPSLLGWMVAALVRRATRRTP